jgi:hypothetical protein
VVKSSGSAAAKKFRRLLRGICHQFFSVRDS